jgi:enediyne biosynthesis protein E4
VYENVTAPRGRSLAVDLRGGAGGHGIGARVTVTAGGRRQGQEVRTGSSYLSQNELTLRFGLATETTAAVAVDWGDGTRQRFARLPADHRVLLVAPAP